MQVVVPSSCGMFKYKFETSIVNSRRASGGMGVFSRMVISSWVLLRSAGMLESVGFRKWSKYAEIFSIGPSIPLTIGLMPNRFLWIFFRK